MYDLVIRGATVVDGLGREPRRADVAVENGRIAGIGEVGRTAERVVDAGGLTLMPGIIDIHTHYDAQVTWDATLSPSPSLGVTTAVMGNCGFGIVPSPPNLRDLIMRNLAVVEGMDIDALRAGINWEFESFAEYLAAVRRRAPYANLAVFVGHSAVRTAVMGEAASVRKQPTPAELAEMKRLVAEAMSQGAVGLGASYSLNHSGWGGVPMPSTISELGEFDALVGAMGERGKGVVGSRPGSIALPRWRRSPGATEGASLWARHWRSTTSNTRAAQSRCSTPARPHRPAATACTSS
jgi:N-acyl-D-amino-acid deacylase